MAEIAPLTPLRYDLSRLKGGLGARRRAPVRRHLRRAAGRARRARSAQRRAPHPPGGGGRREVRPRRGAPRALARRGRSRARRGARVLPLRPDVSRAGQAPGSPATRRRGFLALVRLVPFSERIVLPHERTLSGPKEDRLKLFRATRTNLSPGFMLYRDAAGELDAPLDTAEPLAEFSTPDGVHHALAKVRGARRRARHRRGRRAVDAAHRRRPPPLRDRRALLRGGCSGRRRGRRRAGAGRGEHRYFMTFLANGDDPNLVVFPTHRHVHSLASFSFDELMSRRERLLRGRGARAGRHGRRRPRARSARAGERGPSVAAAAVDGRVALLTLRSDANLDAHPTLGPKPAGLARTDVTVLHAGILEGVLGITPEAQAAKTNLWYPQDAGEALRGAACGPRPGALPHERDPRRARSATWRRPARSCRRRAPFSTRRSPPASPSTRWSRRVAWLRLRRARAVRRAHPRFHIPPVPGRYCRVALSKASA